MGGELIEHWGKVYKTFISLRFFNVYGPRSQQVAPMEQCLVYFLHKKLQTNLYCMR